MTPGLTEGMREFKIIFDRKTGRVIRREYLADWIHTLLEEMEDSDDKY